MKVLVLGGHSNASLGVMRSLSEAGHTVHVLGYRGRFNKCFHTKHCGGKALAPGPKRSPAGFLAVMESVARSRSIRAVIPTSDATARLLAERAKSFALPLVPPLDILLSLQDKALAAELAREAGIAVPVTLTAGRENGWAPSQLPFGFPCVVKGRFSAQYDGERFLSFGTRYVRTEEELWRALADAEGAGMDVVVQERVIGGGMGLSVLSEDGEVVRAFQHRRLRETLPTGSQSSAAQGIPLDMGLLNRVERVCRALSLSGVAMFEFKESEKGSVQMEINGRFWGTLPLAMASGVDFPADYLRLAAGEKVRRDLRYSPGVRARWLRGDIAHSYRVLKGPPSGWDAPFPARRSVPSALLGRGFRSLDSPPGDRRPGWLEALWFLTGGLVSRLTGWGMA